MLLLSLLIGFVSGLRTMTAPALVSWGAALGALPLEGTGLSLLGAPFAPWILTAMAIGELVVDKLPWLPSRMVLIQFLPRLVSGGVSGGAVGVAAGSLWMGVVLGVLGAGLGAVSGAAGRERMSKRVGHDLPGAALEDLVAVGMALGVILLLATR